MQRYWAALRGAAGRLGREVEEALGGPEIPVAAAGKLRRAYEIYLAYPRRCRRLMGGEEAGVAHILDHSFAHLLKEVPRGWKTVVTVHDLIPLRDSAGMTPGQVARFRGKMEMLRGADRLVAVSGSTGDDLIGLLGIPPGKVEVIPNGVERRAEGGAGGRVVSLLEDGGGEVPFTVLSVGLAVPRKNLGILPEAFRAYLGAGGRKARLVRVGDALPRGLVGEIEGVLGAGGVIECGRVGDGELRWLYENADALIFPSRYEGFGLPVLEAMAAGCAVVASSVASHREVGGDCVRYFDPEDAAGAGLALAEVSVGGKGLERRVAAAKVRAAEFTWERHLEGLFRIYGELGVTGSRG